MVMPAATSLGAWQYPLDKFVPRSSEAPAFRQSRLRSGRVIYMPNPAMAQLQEGFAGWLKNLEMPMSCAHGAVPNRSVVTNAAAHRGNRYFYQLDFHDAYGSLDPIKVAEVLCRRSYALRRWGQSPTIDWLMRYCFLPEGGAITGAASVPWLFNIYASDQFDVEFARSRHWLRLIDKDERYTRYLDDLTFSSPRRFGGGHRRSIREAIWRAGFRIADHKTRVNLDITKGPIEICGVMLDANGRIFPSKKRRTRANGMVASALAGRIDPEVAHGHAGACLGALDGHRAERKQRPEVRRVRMSQQRLLTELPYWQGER